MREEIDTLEKFRLLLEKIVVFKIKLKLEKTPHIVFKCVHIIDGKYFSLDDWNTEYVIGEEKCQPAVLPTIGGIGCYESLEDARKWAVSYTPYKQVFLKCVASGETVKYPNGELRVSKITPIEVIEINQKVRKTRKYLVHLHDGHKGFRDYSFFAKPGTKEEQDAAAWKRAEEMAKEWVLRWKQWEDLTSISVWYFIEDDVNWKNYERKLIVRIEREYTVDVVIPDKFYQETRKFTVPKGTEEEQDEMAKDGARKIALDLVLNGVANEIPIDIRVHLSDGEYEFPIASILFVKDV